MHIMLDLETWGKRPGCDIRSIGACVFDPHSMDWLIGPKQWPVSTFYIACDNPVTWEAPSLDGKTMIPTYRYNLTRDPDTVQWWSEQSDEAQGAFEGAVDLRDALQRFAMWLATINAPMATNLRIWAHGPQFDISILETAYHACNLPVPWHYRAPRDTRTIMEAADIDPHKGLDLFATGTHHHALDDAICQAKAVCAAYKVLRSKPAVTITDDMINAYSSTYAGGASPATIAQIDRFAAWMNGATTVPAQGFHWDGNRAVKQSSPELSSLAGHVLNLGATGTPEYNDLLMIAKRLAGSVLSQDETP